MVVPDGVLHTARILLKMCMDMERTARMGTAAGTLVGVAKAANIIAVKVLGAGDRGSGTTADIISGLNFVRDSALASRRPSIASMSLGGGISTALDSAVASRGTTTLTPTMFHPLEPPVPSLSAPPILLTLELRSLTMAVFSTSLLPVRA
ncbi:hypothetical protein H0H87_009272 [Tephrocybe sp. NHM501043]|nr:hypothetical protein H0H87_009272 [Tephrocybe sp. NHM501043]